MRSIILFLLTLAALPAVAAETGESIHCKQLKTSATQIVSTGCGKAACVVLLECMSTAGLVSLMSTICSNDICGNKSFLDSHDDIMKCLLDQSVKIEGNNKNMIFKHETGVAQ